MPRTREAWGERIVAVIGAEGVTRAAGSSPIDRAAQGAALAARGRLYYDHEIPDAFFGGLQGIRDKLRWVRKWLPRSSCIKIGRACAWYARDIEAFIEQRRGAA